MYIYLKPDLKISLFWISASNFNMDIVNIALICLTWIAPLWAQHQSMAATGQCFRRHSRPSWHSEFLPATSDKQSLILVSIFQIKHNNKPYRHSHFCLPHLIRKHLCQYFKTIIRISRTGPLSFCLSYLICKIIVLIFQNEHSHRPNMPTHSLLATSDKQN